MSRIYFHARDGEAKVRGMERYLFASWASQAMINALRLDDRMLQDSPFAKVLPKDLYIFRSPREIDGRSLKNWLTVGYDKSLPMGASRVNLFDMALNTLIHAGGETMKFGARIHGQCEIHGWVDGPNREWLAGIIERGMESHMMRRDMGWQGAINLLKASSESPVVLSYSVCHSFPNYALAGIDGEDEKAFEAWEKLSEGEQWDTCMAILREERAGIEMESEGWDGYFFNDGVTGYDYLDWLESLP